MSSDIHSGANENSQRYWQGVKAAAVMLVLSMVMLAAASSAFAGKFAVTNVDVTPPSNQAGQRGGEVSLTMDFDSENASRLASDAKGDTLKNLTMTMPKGFLGNPNGPEKCSQVDFMGSTCADGSRIGWVDVDTYFTMRLWLAAVIGAACSEACLTFIGMWAPLAAHGGKVYNLTPNAGNFARFGFEIPVVLAGLNLATLRLTADVAVDPNNDHRIVVKTTDEIPNNILGGGADFVVTRMNVRLGSGDTGGGPKFDPTLPTFCDHPAEVKVSAEAHNGLTDSRKGGFPVRDCDTVSFKDPTLKITPRSSENRTMKPYPYIFDLAVPRDPVRSQSAVAGVRIPMPSGFRLSPGVAEGLSTCSPGEFNEADQAKPAQCPESSLLGNAELAMQELGKDPLTGKVYLGEVKTLPDVQGKPKSIATELYIELADERIRYKAIGSMDVAPDGKLTAVFGQDGDKVGGHRPLLGLPWENLKMTFVTPKGRGALVNTFCGIDQSGEAVFTPWSQAPFLAGATKTASSNVAANSLWYDSTTGAPVTGCPAPDFQPSFTAKLSNDQAGSRSNGMELVVTRPAYDRNLGAMTVQLPVGSVPRDPGTYCNIRDAEKDPNSCPAASKLGDLSAKVGFGDETLTLPGKVVAVDPVGTSIVNLLMVLDADLPAFKLGKVAISARVEPIGARYAITVDAGQIPEMIAGVPAPAQTFAVNVVNTNFIRNPLTCTTSWQFDATFQSTGSTPASRTANYQMPCKP